MSLKRQIDSQIKKILQNFSGFSLPSWTNSIGLRIGLISIFLLIFGCYFYKVGSMATMGYKMRDLENKISILEIENQKLSVEIAVWSSIDSIEKRLDKGQMVAVSDIKYIDGSASVVAKK